MTANELADALLDTVCAADPLGASLLGLPGHDDRLADLSAEAEAEVAVAFGALADRAQALPVEGLSETDRQTRDFVAHTAASERDTAALGAIEWTVTDLWVAPAPALIELLPRAALITPEKAAGYLARLAAFPTYLEQAAQRHRDGVSSARTPVASRVTAAIEHLDRVLADENLAGLRVAGGPGVEDAEVFGTERDRLLAESVRPAIVAYRAALADEVVASSRSDDDAGIVYLPGGDKIYATLVRKHTGTFRTPGELHEIGLGIIDALTAEYAEVGKRVFGTSDLAEIFARLRTDPELRYSSAEEMLDDARAVVARASAAAPAWFGRIPSTECAVEAVPAAGASGGPPAYYLPGAVDGSRAGTYFLNTYEATQRTRHTAEVVAFHEAVPGHHFQLSIAQELTELPMARRVLTDIANGEGWGLYCERLADEMGLYSGDVARLGMLAADSWRAARLVVDTGIHAEGWSRERALTWMREHTPLSELETATEIDRYIAYPGQALSYMVGRLELLTLRKRAAEALGEDFVLKDFHDLVLGVGSLPLSVLADTVARWIATRATG